MKTEKTHFILNALQSQHHILLIFINSRKKNDAVFDLHRNANLVCTLALSSNLEVGDHLNSMMHNAFDLEVKLKSRL